MNDHTRARLAGAWFAACAVIFAISVVWGAVVTVAVAQLWVVACVVPPAVMLLVWRGPGRVSTRD